MTLEQIRVVFLKEAFERKLFKSMYSLNVFSKKKNEYRKLNNRGYGYCQQHPLNIIKK